MLETHHHRFPELDIGAAIERIAWEEACHFCVAVAADTSHDDDVARAELLKDFDQLAHGQAVRRHAETMAIPKLRDWMKTFSANAIQQIEERRDDV